MRSFIALGLVAIAGCGGSSTGDVRTTGDALELEIPAPAADRAAHSLEAVPRSSIPVGVFALSLSTSFRHACSRSWMSSSTTAKAKLEIGDGFATLEVNEETSTTSGSHGMAGPPSYSHDERASRLRGTFTELEPGKLQASLAPVSCEGDCASGAIELVCELTRIPLDERTPAEGSGPEPPRGSGGTIEGIVCTGLEKVFDSRVGEGDLPLGAGPGVEVDRTTLGYGSATSKTYRAIAAVTP